MDSILLSAPFSSVLVLEDLPEAHRGILFPPEILAHVFSLLLESYSLLYTEVTVGALLEEALDVRMASQVCRFWRNVALSGSCAHIWGTIINVDTSSEFWVEELLLRSGCAPLLIQSRRELCATPRSFTSPKWNALFCEMHRVQHLDLTFGWNEVRQLARWFFEPAPMLETLALRGDFETPSASLLNFPYLEFVPLIFRQGKHLFGNNSPKLRSGSVTLDRVLFCSCPNNLPNSLNIVRLNLSLTHTHWSELVSRPIETPSASPHSSLVSYANSTAPALVLRNLEELTLTGSQKALQLLSHMIIPHSAMVTLSLTQEPMYDGLDDLLPWLKSYFSAWKTHNNPIYSWFLSTSRKGCFAFHGATKVDSQDCPQFVLEFNTHRRPSIAIVRFLRFLMAEKIVEDSVVLRLDLRTPLYVTHGLKSALRKLFPHCKRLTKLILVARSLKNIFPSLLVRYPWITKSVRALVIEGPFPAFESETTTRMVNDYLYARCIQNIPGLKLKVDAQGYWNGTSVVRRGELPPQNFWSIGSELQSSCQTA